MLLHYSSTSTAFDRERGRPPLLLVLFASPAATTSLSTDGHEQDDRDNRMYQGRDESAYLSSGQVNEGELFPVHALSLVFVAVWLCENQDPRSSRRQQLVNAGPQSVL